MEVGILTICMNIVQSTDRGLPNRTVYRQSLWTDLFCRINRAATTPFLNKCYNFLVKKAELSNDKEMAQSERNSHSKKRDRKKHHQVQIVKIDTKRTYRRLGEQLLP